MARPPSERSIADTEHASEFGAALRDTREAHGKSIADVSDTLRVRQTYLTAIEEGRFDDLPGATYAAGFIRGYADYLGLDVNEVMQRYREISRDQPGHLTAGPPSPVVEARLPTGFILFAAAILVLVAYGAWYYLTLHGRNAGDVVAKIPQEIAGLVNGENKPAGKGGTDTSSQPAEAPKTEQTATEPAEPTEPAPAPEPVAAPPSEQPADNPPAMAEINQNAEQQPGPAEAAQPAETPEPVSEPAPAADQPDQTASAPAADDNPDSTPPPQEIAETPAPAPAERETTAEQPAAPAQPAESAPPAVAAATPPEPELTPPARPAPPQGRVMLRATASSWVELRRANGERVLSQILRAGETYRVPSERGISLTTGNAGGIYVLVDGNFLAPLGPVGAVRRDVSLDPSSLRDRLRNP